jgi:hypothetical protein
MPEKGEELYKILKADPNYEGVGSDYGKFKAFFSDEKNYTNLYNTLKADPNYEGIGKDVNAFSDYFGLKKKEQAIPFDGQQFGGKGEEPLLPLTSSTASPSVSKQPKSTIPLESTGAKSKQAPAFNLEKDVELLESTKNRLKSYDAEFAKYREELAPYEELAKANNNQLPEAQLQEYNNIISQLKGIEQDYKVDYKKHKDALDIYNNKINAENERLKLGKEESDKKAAEKAKEIQKGLSGPASRIKLYSDAIQNIQGRIPQMVEQYNMALQQGDEAAANEIQAAIKADSEKLGYFDKAIKGQKQLAEIQEPNTFANRIANGFTRAGGFLAGGVNFVDDAVNQIQTEIMGDLGFAYSDKFKKEFEDFKNSKEYSSLERPSDKIAAAGAKLMKKASEKSELMNMNAPYQGGVFEAIKAGDFEIALTNAAKAFTESFPTSVLMISNPFLASAGMAQESVNETEGAVTSNDYIAGALKASFELAFENLFGTGKALKEMVSAIGRDAAIEATEKAVKHGMKELAKKWGVTWAEETLGEGATQLASNIVDKKMGKEIGYFDGVADASLIGSFGGLTQGTATTTLTHYIDRAKTREYESKKSQAAQLAERAAVERNPVVAEAIEAQAEKIETEAGKIAVEQNKIGATLPLEVLTKIEVLNSEIDELEVSLNEVEPDLIPIIEAQIEEKNNLINELAKQTTGEVPQEGGKTENEVKVEELRAQEQVEKDATDPNDQEKLDEIYDRYNKLITPLLEGAKEKAVEEDLKDVEFGTAFDIQDATAENTVGKEKDLWGKSQVWRERIENAGDILRELSSRGDKPDVRYLMEKVKKLRDWIAKNKNGYTPIDDSIKTTEDFEKSNLKWTDAVDSREYLEKFNSSVLDRVKREYEAIPTYTKEQRLALELVLDLINNNIKGLESKLSGIEEISNQIKTNGSLPIVKDIKLGKEQTLEAKGQAVDTEKTGENTYEYDPKNEVSSGDTGARTDNTGTEVGDIASVTDKGESGKEVVSEAEVDSVAKTAGVTPKNIRDLYNIGRDLFALNRVQALAQAVVMDKMIGAMAKRKGVKKSEIYKTIQFKKANEKDLPQGVKMQVDAWHGSPYEFDKFQTEFMGKGEGAQAFGWGLYFTDLESIARNYAKKLSGDTYSYDGKSISKEAYDYLFLADDSLGEDFNENTIRDIAKIAIDKINKVYIPDFKEIAKTSPSEKQRKEMPNEIKRVKGVIKELQDIIASKEIKLEKNKNLYKVSIQKGKDQSEYTWLEWDKPVARGVISQFIETLNQDYDFKKNYGNSYLKEIENGEYDNLKGKDFYNGLAKSALQKLGKFSDRDISLALLASNIDGIKYPAESMSRGATSDTARGFNYVVFDENAISIEETIKFQKDAVKARGAMMMNMDGQAVIYALSDPNVSTPLHELAHVFEHYLTESEKNEIIKAAGTKGWTIETSEYFARGFEKYLADGKAPSKGLQKLFDKFKEWLTEIYNGITDSNIDVELNEKMEGIYSQMLGVAVKKKKQKFSENVLDIAKEAGLSPRQVENTYNKYDGTKNIEDITLEDYNKARAEGNKVKLENSKKAFEALLKEEAAKDKVSPTAQKELSKIKEGLDDKALKSASKIMENISEVREKLLKAGFIQSIDCKWG